MILQSLLVLAMVFQGTSEAHAAPAAKSKKAALSPKKAAAAKNLEDNLQGAVEDAKLKLKDMTPWQKVLFQEEVVPQYRRFIREFRQSGDNIRVDVDYESIRKFLALGASRDALQPEERIVIHVAAEPGCDKCAEAVIDVRKAIKARMDRRGYKQVVLSPEELGASKALGAEVNEKALHSARSKGLSGALVIQLSLVPPDVDSAHADEKNYLARIFMTLLAQEARPEMKADGTLEILESESLAQGAERLMTDAFTDFGGKILAQQKAEDPQAEEILIVLKGIGNFEHYSRIKIRLKELLKDVGAAEERKSARGMVAFGIRTRKAPEQIHELLRPLNHEEEKPVQVEIQLQ